MSWGDRGGLEGSERERVLIPSMTGHYPQWSLLPGLHQHVEVDPVLAGPGPEHGLAPVLAAVLRQHRGDEESHLAEEEIGGKYCE